MKAQVKKITPKKAVELLEANNGNRKIRPSHVRAIANDISNGGWVRNGSGIIWDAKSNKLIDGQHRLHAVALSGKAITTVFTTIDDGEKAFATLDTGRPRTTIDVLHTNRDVNKYIPVVAAVLKLIKCCPEGKGWSSRRLTNVEACEMYDMHGDLVERCVAETNDNLLRKMMFHSVAAFVRFVTAGIDEHKSDQFFDTLTTGLTGRGGRAALRLREVLLQNVGCKPRYRNYHIIELSAIAWRAFVKGENLTTLRVSKNKDGDWF